MHDARDKSSANSVPASRRAGVVVAAVLAAALPRVSFAGPEPKPTAPNATSRVEITRTESSWDNLSELFLGSTPASPFGEGSVFVMRGELRNNGRTPLAWVLLRYELLDADGKVLEDVEGYNRGAESMRPDEEGAVRPEKVTPIAAGGTDSYRMVFFHDEVPRFVSQRVRVVEVHEATPGAAAAPTHAPKTIPVPEEKKP